MSVFNQQIELIEKYLEEELSKRIEHFSMGEFTKTIMYVLYLVGIYFYISIAYPIPTKMLLKDRVFEISLKQLIFKGSQK